MLYTNSNEERSSSWTEGLDWYRSNEVRTRICTTRNEERSSCWTVSLERRTNEDSNSIGEHAAGKEKEDKQSNNTVVRRMECDTVQYREAHMRCAQGQFTYRPLHQRLDLLAGCQEVTRRETNHITGDARLHSKTSTK